MFRKRTLRRAVLGIALLGFVAMPIAAFLILWFTLPSVDHLQQRAQSSSSKIVDRNGFLLYEIIDPRVGHHTPLSTDQIPIALRQATVAVEDSNFYSNPGVDFIGIIRALWINVQGGEVLAGGSTITQQLARNLVLESDERVQRTLLRKVRESLLAWQIAQQYSKDEVLTLYLNESYYGNLAYGVEAAAHTYFNKGVSELDLAECALLSGLVQSPISDDPLNDPEAAKKRQNIVLDLMVKTGYISSDEAQVARQAHLSYAPAPFSIRAPHFVTYVRHWIEERYGTELLTRGGVIVTTTLDLSLNESAQDIIRSRLTQLKSPTDNSPGHNTNDAALVAMDPHSGAIISMIGSPDFFDAGISGAVNASVVLRQPGSAIKPITYAAALSSVPGFNAATPIIDVRTSFPTREGVPYVPDNYDRAHHGPISARMALATSNNVAAVSVLQMVGLDRMLGLANAMGIHSFQSAEAYGLSLTLGGGEVRLLELTSAYATLANAGEPVSPYGVSRITDTKGDIIYAHEGQLTSQKAVDLRVAWLITDILADNAARSDAFGLNSVLRLDRPAAVKTGTTTDWRDNWTVGYTPDLVTGVWTGNADNEPMVRISGVAGAGPIWHDFMEVANRGQATRGFVQPQGMVQVEVCTLSGLLPSSDCPHTRMEWFIDGTQPTKIDDWFVRVKYDVTTGKLADASTPNERVTEKVAVRLPVSAASWGREQGWLIVDDSTHTRGGVGDPAIPKCDTLVDLKCDAATVIQPDNGSMYKLSSQLPPTVQRVPLQIRIDDIKVQSADIILDDAEVIATFSTSIYQSFWTLKTGDHSFTVRLHYPDGTTYNIVPTLIHVTD